MNQVYYDKYGNKRVVTTRGQVFYDEDGMKILMNTNRGIIGYGLYGIVYPYSEDKCLKYITNTSSCNQQIISDIKEMKLSNFYEIYKLLFDKHHDFAGYIMKYYDNKEMNILTSPTDYTLDNYRDINDNADKLSKKGIYMQDLHSDNVILCDDKIIIIDVDNYTYLDNSMIFQRNADIVKHLFYDIYIDCVCKYYALTKEEYVILRRLFGNNRDTTVYDELKGYKYPIDYIKKKNLVKTNYVMRKGDE